MLAILLVWLALQRVPDVVGRDIAVATVLLADKGFAVGHIYERESTAPRWQVLEQDPKGGAQAVKTHEVRLFVSKGPKP